MIFMTPAYPKNGVSFKKWLENDGNPSSMKGMPLANFSVRAKELPIITLGFSKFVSFETNSLTSDVVG